MPKKTDLTLLLINTVEEPIFYLSSDFIILDLNAFAKKIFKITKNSIIGKPFSVLCSDQDLKSLEHPFDRNLKTCLRKNNFMGFIMFKKAYKWNSIYCYRDH